MPMAIQSAAINLSMIFVNSMINALGVVESASFGVGCRIDDIINKISMGVQYAAMPMISQNLGAGDNKRAKEVVYKTWIVSVILTAIFMTLLMAALMIVGAVQLKAAQQETAVMLAHVENLQAENEELQNYFDTHCDLDEIERTAMALGMVPIEQVTHVTIRVPQEIVEEQPGAWERFTTFLTGLFA